MSRLEARSRSLLPADRPRVLRLSLQRIPFRSAWVWPQIMLLTIAGVCYRREPRVACACACARVDRRPAPLAATLVHLLQRGRSAAWIAVAIGDPLRLSGAYQLPEQTTGADDPVMAAMVKAVLARWKPPAAAAAM